MTAAELRTALYEAIRDGFGEAEANTPAYDLDYLVERIVKAAGGGEWRPQTNWEPQARIDELCLVINHLDDMPSLDDLQELLMERIQELEQQD